LNDYLDLNKSIEELKESKESFFKIADSRKSKSITEYMKNIIYRGSNIFNTFELKDLFQYIHESKNKKEIDKLLEFLILYSKYFPNILLSYYNELYNCFENENIDTVMILKLFLNMGEFLKMDREFEKKVKKKLEELIKSDYMYTKYSLKLNSILLKDKEMFFDDFLSEYLKELKYDQNILICLTGFNEIVKLKFDMIDLDLFDNIINFILNEVFPKEIVNFI
jgi:hypothetical protein